MPLAPDTTNLARLDLAVDPAITGPAFLDPRALIEASRTRPKRYNALPMLALAIVAILVFTAPADSPVGALLSRGAPVLFLVMLVGLNVWGRRGAAMMAIEAQAVTALDELVQLRRWPEAAELAMRLFSRPMLSAERRMHALIGLATILTRYHRFDDARVVHDYLLNKVDDTDDSSSPIPLATDPAPDASTAHAIRVARAMGLLREDRLVDADRAMVALRREVNQARDEVRRAAGPDAATKVRSAGLVLLDLYRDVKTRHYEEAVANFTASLDVLKDQLGSRVADAWVLYAASLDGLDRADEAKVAYAAATTLTPPVELHRRYPETVGLATKYPATKWPA